MTAEDATAYTVLEVIIQRAYILGGINMSEHSTKFLTSLMLEVTGARSMLVSERKKWHSYLKAELKKLVRDREPLEYIVELPATPNLMKKEYPQTVRGCLPKRRRANHDAGSLGCSGIHCSARLDTHAR